MMRGRIRSVAVVGAIAVGSTVLAGCGAGTTGAQSGADAATPSGAPAATSSPATTVPASGSPTTTSPAAPTTTPAARCLAPPSTWTTAALAAQLVVVIGTFTAMSALSPEAAAGAGALVFIGHPGVGTGPTIAAHIASLQAQATANGHVAPWMATTEEGGTVTRLANVLGAMPSARQLATTSVTAIEVTAAHQGAGMRSLGLTMDLAPVLDTAPPTNRAAAENTRSFSDTGHVAGADGLAFARGMLGAGEVPVVKHFPGLGHATADTDTAAATVPPLPTLEGDDLIPFEEAARAGLPAVMVGNQIVPDLTSGQPASLSPAAYRLLRDTLGFQGVTMTDALTTGAIAAAGDDGATAAVGAIGAGADMAMVDAATWASVQRALERALGTGQLAASQVDAAVRRILAAKHLTVCAS